jgi:hypothetical protein
MIEFVISLIIVVLILGFLFWAAQQLLPLIPVAEPFRTILRILVAFLILVVVLWFFVQMLGFAGIHVAFPGRL